MSKRTTTDTVAAKPTDFWPTPPEAVQPLVPHLKADCPRGRYVEPCAGSGALADALKAHGFACVAAFDINPARADIKRADASKFVIPGPSIPLVTNPPWRRDLLEPILQNIIGKTTVWLLLPLDYVANLWTNPYMRHVSKLIPLGRVSWLGNGKAGMENSMWARFDIKPQGFITERKAK